MENKEMKKPIPVELNDDTLDNVSGGGIDTHINFIPSGNFNYDIESQELDDDALESITGGIACEISVCKQCGATGLVVSETQLCETCHNAAMYELYNNLFGDIATTTPQTVVEARMKHLIQQNPNMTMEELQALYAETFGTPNTISSIPRNQ